MPIGIVEGMIRDRTYPLFICGAEALPLLEPDLKRYVAAGIVLGVNARRTEAGWELIAQLKNEALPLSLQRGGARQFKTLDAVSRMVESLGLVGFSVSLI